MHLIATDPIVNTVICEMLSRHQESHFVGHGTGHFVDFGLAASDQRFVYEAPYRRRRDAGMLCTIKLILL